MDDPKDVRLVETTLRDGGYEIDFQFTAEDTAFLAGTLDRAGFTFIELCHGVGFGVNRWPKQYRPKVRATTSDEDHLAAARAVVSKASIGVILVVGENYTPIEELDALPKLGVSFVRLAFFPQQITQASCLAYVDRAKALGLLVSINLMQTYAMSPQAVAAASIEVRRR